MPRTQTDTHALSAELVALLRLTRTEAQIARIRVSQAKDDSIRRELLDNAEEADLRALRIQDELRRLGATPDIIGDAVGRVLALSKATAEQLQPFSEGLLGDLTLEHQLRDRVVFARVLAEAQDEPTVVALMNDLEAAHTETIEWIQVRLAELAQGGPVALAPTPPQAAFSTLARLAVLPSRRTADLLNRVLDTVQRGRGKAQEATEAALSKARQTAEASAEVAQAGRDAALARTEQVAPDAGVRKAAGQARSTLGTVDAEALPIDGYDALASGAAVSRIRDLEDADELRLVLRYEEAHKNRSTVTTAVERRLTELAEEAVGA